MKPIINRVLSIFLHNETSGAVKINLMLGLTEVYDLRFELQL